MVEITTEKKEQAFMIIVDGDIDAGSSIHLDNALTEAVKSGEVKIAIDLTKLKYISSAGLGVFISHVDEFEKSNVTVHLFGINESVKQVFDILGLDKLLKIMDKEEEALQAF